MPLGAEVCFRLLVLSNMKNHFLVHLPHSSFYVPEEYKDSFCVSAGVLRREQLRMTDAYTDELFHDEALTDCYVINPVSRLLCDVERFRDDKDEYNAKIGQGLMYTRGAFGRKLRDYDTDLRERILADFYDPHHKKLTEEVLARLEETGKCTILDGHSFNSVWPVKLDCLFDRPDFCIGTDPFHTPDALRDALLEVCRSEGYHARVNTPYSGAITPICCYGKDKRVVSIMVEVNRKLYMNEKTGEKTENFDEIARVCRKLMKTAAEYENE